MTINFIKNQFDDIFQLVNEKKIFADRSKEEKSVISQFFITNLANTLLNEQGENNLLTISNAVKKIKAEFDWDNEKVQNKITKIQTKLTNKFREGLDTSGLQKITKKDLATARASSFYDHPTQSFYLYKITRSFHYIPQDILTHAVLPFLTPQDLVKVSTVSSRLETLALESRKSVISLDLSKTRHPIYEQPLKEVINEFPNLKFLNLSSCTQLTNQSLVHLKSLQKLTTLKLRGCDLITNQGLEHLKSLQNLCSLDLSYGTQITDQDLERIGSLEKLITLNFSMCYQITDQGLEHLNNLQNLTTLDLATCFQITDQGLEHLKSLRNLTALDLSLCHQITDQGLEHLKDLQNFTTLDFSSCKKITDQGLEHLKGLQNLTILNISHCYQITDQGLKHLKSLQKPTTLNLWGCNQITNQGLEHLKSLQNLIMLNLCECDQITNHGLEQLEKALPQAQIIK